MVTPNEVMIGTPFPEKDLPVRWRANLTTKNNNSGLKAPLRLFLPWPFLAQENLLP
jgi:hypothetical protein